MNAADLELVKPSCLKPGNRYDLLVPVTKTTGDDVETIDHLQLRRLTAADMLLDEKPGTLTERLLTIIEGMTGLPRVITIKLDAADLENIDDIFRYFRWPGSVTGVTS